MDIIDHLGEDRSVGGFAYMSEKAGKRQTAIASKSPCQPGHRSHNANTGYQADNGNGTLHGGGSFGRVRCLVEDLDAGEARRGVQHSIHIANEEKYNEHEAERHNAVDYHRVHYNPWHDFGRVTDLFTHVDGTIEAYMQPISISDPLLLLLLLLLLKEKAPICLPRKQYVTVSIPMHHEIPLLVQPPSFMTVLKTNSGVLLGASKIKGTDRAIKKTTWKIPPKSCNNGRI